MFEETGFMMGAGPEDDEPAQTVKLPKQATISVDLPEEVKQEIAFTFELGNRKISNAMDVMESEDKMTYIIDDLLPDTGLVYIGGLSGTGKTILAIQFVANVVLGRPTMTWKLGDDFKDQHLRTLFLSLEMNKKDLQQRLLDMFPSLTEEEQKLFRENFLTYTEPEPFQLWNLAHILDLTRIIKACKPHIVLIDSASVSFASSLKDDTQVNQSIQNLYLIRSRLNVAMMVVSHTRKPPPGIASNPEEVTLNELFGHSGVAQSAAGILIMVEDERARKETIKRGDAEKTEKLVHIINAKARFGANASAFKAYLTSKDSVDKGEPLMFKRNAIAIGMTDEQKRRMKSAHVTSADVAEALSDAFSNNLDFGSDLGGDE